MSQEHQNQIVKKHVAAIHVNAKLSLLQRKLVNALLFNAYNNLLTIDTHEISTLLLCEMIGFDSNNQDYLKSALRGLMETVVEFNIFEDGTEAWEIMSLFSYAKIKGGKCQYRYDRALAEKLFKPEIYSQINLGVLRELKSVHALVLYENCHRYINMNPSQTKWMDLDVFRKLMGVDNMESYKSFKVLNRAVIKPAMKEINEHSNILIELETQKAGRAVSQIRFVMKENPQLSLGSFQDDPELVHIEAYQALLDEGISKALARSWLIEYGEEYVLEKLQLAKRRQTEGKIKSSVSGFLRSAVEQDFSPTEAEIKADEMQRKAIRRSQLEREIEAKEAKLRELDNAHRMAAVQAIEAHLSSLSESEAELLADQFVDTLQMDIQRKDFRKRGWKSALFFAEVQIFWNDRISLPSRTEIASGLGIESLLSYESETTKLKAELKAT